MLATQVEDTAGRPCYLCGAADPKLVAIRPGKRIPVIPVCEACGRLPDVRERVEAVALASEANENEAVADGWEIDGHMAHEPGRPIPAWVKDALATGRFRWPAAFIWVEGPPQMVYVRDGNDHVWANVPADMDPDDLPPPPPELFAMKIPGVDPGKRRRPDPAEALRRHRRKKKT